MQQQFVVARYESWSAKFGQAIYLWFHSWLGAAADGRRREKNRITNYFAYHHLRVGGLTDEGAQQSRYKSDPLLQGAATKVPKPAAVFSVL